MAIPFDYPQNGWSTGKMRKRGQQLAMDYQQRGQPTTNLAEMEKAAGFGLGARGITGGVGAAVPMRTTPTPGTALEDHRAQIQDAVNQVSQGDMTPQGLKKILKKLGWGGGDNGKFTDPTGEQHEITPQTAEAQ